MEKSNLCRNKKQQSMSTQSDNSSKSLMKDLYCYKFKSSSAWHFGNNEGGGGGEGDLSFSWPPRSYTCSFCKREFRSAQALGGHMNVHRRDRARLNQSPVRDSNHGQFPLLNLSLDLNPSSSCHYPKCPRLPPLFTPAANPCCHSPDLMEMKSGKLLLEKLDEKAEFVRLDLEIGLINNQSYEEEEEEEELDLELRLGYC